MTGRMRRGQQDTAGRRRGPAAATAVLLSAMVGMTLLAGCGGSGRSPAPDPGPRPHPARGPTEGLAPGAGGATPREDGTPAGDGAELALPAGWSWVAHADVPQIKIFGRPGDDEPRWTLASPNPRGVPLLFGVEERQPAWLRVKVPVRPNGSVGWVRTADTTISTTPFELLVDRSEHQLTIFRDNTVVTKLPVGIGTGATPTPTGTFYLTELLRPGDPNGPWGPFAFGLSGFSDVITQFNGAEGIIGLHGTNRPDLVGSDVSMGCVRLRNADLLRLVDVVPLGTPITIVG
ncbi:ErfK/YbiS/YcfS/YnhG family protein [Parafrankia sp. Ea1.12]|uniref:L,D-transpeptidase n=1 Tax=Parafrankia sp. Ea1.12 TaxID=573499 RepID=UPI000DA5007D|nr:L,D-transpeptidase [Parafrankia sp. Ea1.12]SQE00574.1 ErfK/YbiS/YcfS/YnhG family protein [Parafrankia sp. Ea1.12]